METVLFLCHMLYLQKLSILKKIVEAQSEKFKQLHSMHNEFLLKVEVSAHSPGEDSNLSVAL